MTTSSFRRAFIDRETSRACVEVGAGELWSLPNPTPDGRSYDPERVVMSVIRAGEVNLERWERVP